jgi:L-alanine-DL-glutamate epimerase-like enolase superfamily enzyme
MRLVGATLYALRIPFVEGFTHSATARSSSESIVVGVRDETGVVGFGEGAPRPYVTGETLEMALAHVAEALWPHVAERPLPEAGDLDALGAVLPDVALPGTIAPHASRAALELAILDCALRRAGRSLATVLPPRRTRVVYSGIITAGPLERVILHARRMRVVGFRHVKLKVGFDDDVARVSAAREALGLDISLRLDANGAWSFERAVEVLNALEAVDVAAIEQPLARGAAGDLARLRGATPVPVMADESLVTAADAEALLAEKAVDFFNVRVSKCGGLARSLAIATRALEAGVGVQVGSQVGETAILSAAGRHLAAALPAVTFVEGSFGTLLLAEDVSVETVRFGHRGEALVLTGVGLGVTVDEARLRRHAVTVKEA